MKKKIKVGIIGGGQLGMMLAEASSKLNIVPLIYSNTKDSPAAKVAKTYYGDFNDDKKISEHGGKLDFAKWSNKNMLVIAQIESVPGWDNLDEILSVEGLSGITGGPNDLAASMGIPGEPDNPKRQKLTSDIEALAREKNKIVQDDIIRTLALSLIHISEPTRPY